MVAAACIVAAVGLVYLNALDNPFVYDDYRMVVENRSLLDLTRPATIIVHEVTRPFVNLSYALDRAVWGPEPFGFRLTNVLLHALNVALLLALAVRLARDQDANRTLATGSAPHAISLVAGALFALHPMMTEAVAYVSGRSELLCAFFFLLAMAAGRQWLLTGQARWAAGWVACWLAALATKESAVAFPVVLALYDWLLLPSNRASRRRRALRVYLPVAAVMAAAALVRLGVFVGIEHPGATLRWSNALVELDVMRQYLRLMLMPDGQTIFHAVTPITSVFDPRVTTALLVVALVLGLAWVARRVSPLATFGTFWFFLLLVPSSALLVLDRGEPMAEHRVYLASCGLFLTFGAAAERLVTRSDRMPTMLKWAAVGGALLATLSLAGRTVMRNALWSDPVALWEEAARKAPDHWLPRLALGEELQRAGRHEEALDSYRLAARLRPDEVTPYRKLGGSLLEARRAEEAVAVFRAWQRLEPRSVAAAVGLGAAAIMTGQLQEARAALTSALDWDPGSVPARQALAALEEAEANPGAALRLCEDIRRIAPDTPGNDDCIRRNQSRLGIAPADR